MQTAFALPYVRVAPDLHATLQLSQAYADLARRKHSEQGVKHDSLPLQTLQWIGGLNISEQGARSWLVSEKVATALYGCEHR